MLQYLVYFFIYSFLGWIIDTVSRTIEFKKFTEHSYFKIGLCPVYGFGGLFIISPMWDNFSPLSLALIYFFGLTALEYVTAVFLEDTLHKKLWSYENDFLNFKGRISLFRSLGWTALGLLTKYYIQPFISGFI